MRPLYPQGFQKLNDANATSRFLFVANCGKNVAEVKDNYESLCNLLRQHCPTLLDSAVMLVPGKPFINVAFPKEEYAIAAKEQLNHRPLPELENRRLHIEFAQPRVSTTGSDTLQSVPSTPVDLPAGLTLVPDYVTESEENDLLGWMDNQEWLAEFGRRVVHFGHTFNYSTRTVDTSTPTKPIPSQLCSVLERYQGRDTIDQVTANEYLPGQGIRPHCDTHSAFDGAIVIVSLGCATVMDFRHPHSNKKLSLVLQPRSMLVMDGEARYLWTHGIAHRKVDRVDGVIQPRGRRVSLTFRTVRESRECRCAWPTLCDTAQAEALKEEAAEESIRPTALEQEHVHRVYEEIAEHFSHTRHTPWPRIQQFVQSLPRDTFLADVGCGNGKYLNVLPPGVVGMGCDRSSNLVSITSRRGHESFVADALLVPLRTECADVTISVAVLHHMSTHFHRIRALQELLRITKVGGHVLVSAWAKDQSKTQGTSSHTFDDNDVMVKWCLHKSFAEEKLSDDYDAGHGVVDHDSGTVRFMRYCHVYDEGELEELFFEAAGGVSVAKDVYEVTESYVDTGNHVVIVHKTGAFPRE